MKTFLLTVSLLVNCVSFAATKSELCRENTSSEKAYEICINSSKSEKQIPACAKFALFKDNTFKTLPFEKCLQISEARQLSVEKVTECGNKSGTHLGFIKCLQEI